METKRSVEHGSGVETRYPDPVLKNLAFDDTPLAVLEGHIQIVAKDVLPRDTRSPRRAILKVQARSLETSIQPDELFSPSGDRGHRVRLHALDDTRILTFHLGEPLHRPRCAESG